MYVRCGVFGASGGAGPKVQVSNWCFVFVFRCFFWTVGETGVRATEKTFPCAQVCRLTTHLPFPRLFFFLVTRYSHRTYKRMVRSASRLVSCFDTATTSADVCANKAMTRMSISVYLCGAVGFSREIYRKKNKRKGEMTKKNYSTRE